MISFSAVSSLDVVVVVIVLFFVIRGGWIGLMRQLAAFFALVGSYLLAGRYTGQLVPYVDDYVDNTKLVFLISFALLFILSASVFILLGKVMHKVMEISLLGWFDRLLGVALGLVKGAVLVSLLYMLLASSLSASNDIVRNSLTTPYLQLGAAELQRWINDPAIRKYFHPREPAIQAPERQEEKPPVQPDSPASGKT